MRPVGFTIERKAKEKTFPSFRDAEKAARRSFGRVGFGGVYHYPDDPAEKPVLLASIGRDGEGNLWTDLTMAGCQFA